MITLQSFIDLKPSKIKSRFDKCDCCGATLTKNGCVYCGSGFEKEEPKILVQHKIEEVEEPKEENTKETILGMKPILFYFLFGIFFIIALALLCIIKKKKNRK